MKPFRIKRYLLSFFILFLALSSYALSTDKGRRHIPFGSIERYIEVMEEPERAAWQMPERVVEVLPIRPGWSIADIGAGSGYFSRRFSRAVGPGGTVYAVDIEKGMIDYIDKRSKDEGFKNIKTILAKPDDPLLEEKSVDMVFICDTFHHIEDRTDYVKRLMPALRPGGRLVIVDFKLVATPVGPPMRMRLSREQVIREVEAGGFELEGEFYFLPYQYFLIFTRPRQNGPPGGRG